MAHVPSALSHHRILHPSHLSHLSHPSHLSHLFAPVAPNAPVKTYDVAVTPSTLLWLLLALFALRVLGQLLVVLGLAPFLPRMDDWQSGVLPYSMLLASQILILGVLATVCVQFSRRKGYFIDARKWLATPLWVAGWIYAVGMVVRYAVLRRDLIPVVFHVVLASFLLVVAHHHRHRSCP